MNTIQNQEMQALIKILIENNVGVSIDTSREGYTNVSVDFTEHDKTYLDKIEKLKTENEELKLKGILPDDPIMAVHMLISAKKKYKLDIYNPYNPFGDTTVIDHIYGISELKQIAEHLLVYCNANGEDEK